MTPRSLFLVLLVVLLFLVSCGSDEPRLKPTPTVTPVMGLPGPQGIQEVGYVWTEERGLQGTPGVQGDKGLLWSILVGFTIGFWGCLFYLKRKRRRGPHAQR